MQSQFLGLTFAAKLVDLANAGPLFRLTDGHTTLSERVRLDSRKNLLGTENFGFNGTNSQSISHVQCNCLLYQRKNVEFADLRFATR